MSENLYRGLYRKKLMETWPEDINADYVDEMLNSIEGRVVRIYNKLVPIEGITEIDALRERVSELLWDLQY